MTQSSIPTETRDRTTQGAAARSERGGRETTPTADEERRAARAAG